MSHWGSLRQCEPARCQELWDKFACEGGTRLAEFALHPRGAGNTRFRKESSKMNRNISKALWTLGSLIGAQQAAKFVRGVGGIELGDILGAVGLERRPSAFARVLP